MGIELEKKKDRNYLFAGVSGKIIGGAFTVMNSLGSGFLEKIYENALGVELQNAGLKVIPQKPIKVFYRDILVGEYTADMVVEDQVLVELKAVKELEEVHYAQCLNYLKATGFKVCLLLNFGKPKLQMRRISARKEWLKK